MPTTAPAASAPARRRLYRVAELADMWELDRSTVYRMIYAGRLRAERHGPRGRAIRIPADAVAEYLKTVTHPAESAEPAEAVA